MLVMSFKRSSDSYFKYEKYILAASVDSSEMGRVRNTKFILSSHLRSHVLLQLSDPGHGISCENVLSIVAYSLPFKRK